MKTILICSPDEVIASPYEYFFGSVKSSCDNVKLSDTSAALSVAHIRGYVSKLCVSEEGRERAQLSFMFLSVTLVKENGSHLIGLFSLNGLNFSLTHTHTHRHTLTPEQMAVVVNSD